MDVAAIAVAGGLADPVFDSQAIFRAVMGAFAEPGTVADLGSRVSAPPPLVPAAAACLAALAEDDTPVWLEDPDGDGRAAAAWLRFHTGAPIATEPAAARFVVLNEGTDPGSWARFAIGTPDYPDRSATLLLPVRSLAGGMPLVLTGPGIEIARTIAPAGLPAGFVAAREANRARFPLGCDVVLVCGTALLALPRTTRILEA